MEPVHDPAWSSEEEGTQRRRRRVTLPKSESACKSLSTQQMKSEWKLKYTQRNSQSQAPIFLSLKSTAEKINKTPKTQSHPPHPRLKFMWFEIKLGDCAFITTKKYKDKMYITYKTTLLYKIWSTSVAVNNFKNLQDGWIMTERLQ